MHLSFKCFDYRAKMTNLNAALNRLCEATQKKQLPNDIRFSRHP